MIEKHLTSLGLSSTEIKVYLALLPLQSALASSLGQQLKIPRTTSKYACEQLVQKGLASKLFKNKYWFYSPTPPKNLLNTIEQKKREIEEKEKDFSEAYPALQALYEKTSFAPSLQFYEGVAGVIEMFEDVLQEGAPIYGALSFSEEMHPEVLAYINQRYVIKRKELFLPARMLFNDTPLTREYRENDSEMNRISLLVPNDKYPFEICFHVYGEKIALYSYNNNLVSGVIIKDQNIHKMHLSLFRLAWNYASLLKANVRYKESTLS